MWKLLQLSVFIFLLPFCDAAISYGQHPFTGTFIANPKLGVMYLVLTQTQEGVSGSLTIVAPDKNEGTRSITLALHGSTDGNAISLNAAHLVLNGRRDGDNITLMFPSDSGIISTATFVPGSETEFNKIVTNLRELFLAAIKADQETDKLKKSEKEKLTMLAKALEDDVLAIKRTGIKSDLHDIASALNNEYLEIRQLDEDLGALQRDASVRPMTCYQAYQTVEYDFRQTLGYDYNQTLGYANSQYKGAVNRLEERLSRVENMVDKIREEAQELNQAIKESRFTLPKLNIMPGEERPALEEYQMLAGAARKELPNLKAKNEEVLNKAKEIMREGRAAMEKAQSLVTCR